VSNKAIVDSIVAYLPFLSSAEVPDDINIMVDNNELTVSRGHTPARSRLFAGLN
jgi:hypothetical protein